MSEIQGSGFWGGLSCGIGIGLLFTGVGSGLGLLAVAVGCYDVVAD